MKKNYMKKILYLLLIILITFFIVFIGTKNTNIDRIVDKIYNSYILVMFTILIILFILNILPIELKKIKIKRIMNKDDYIELENFLKIDEPNDDDLEFPTFTDTSSAVISIVLLSKEDLSFTEPLEFTPEEKKNIKKYQKIENEYARYIVDYYKKCETIILIINKYYDSTGKLKKK